MTKILGATVQNLVARDSCTPAPEFLNIMDFIYGGGGGTQLHVEGAAMGKEYIRKF
jgi:hypothetical protein